MASELPAVLSETLYVYAGDDFTFPIEFADDVDTPTDLTGLTITSQWRKTRGSSEYVDLLIEETDLANGQISLVIPGSASTAMFGDGTESSVRGVFDIQGFNGTSNITFLQGTLAVTRDVTRD